jgi:GT2 family glycosyltransferase
MNISVVIPNFNGQNLLSRNLPKVFDAVGDAEVIVIDDASKDGSLKVLERFGTKIKIIKNEKNLGFSASINKGVKGAKGEIVVLLNTDVVPEKMFLAPLISHFKDANIFAVGCMDKSIEKGKVILRGRGVGKWKRGLFVHSRGEVDKTNTLWVNGGSGAFRKSAWEKLGGLDEIYSPFYWEDIDLSYRALKSGYKIVFESKSIVVHEHEKGAIKSAYSESEVRAIAYRNQFIFIWKNITDYSMRLSHFIWLPFHVFSAILRGDVAFIRGIFNAFVLLPKIIKYSNKERKIFILKDEQIMRPFK